MKNKSDSFSAPTNKMVVRELILWASQSFPILRLIYTLIRYTPKEQELGYKGLGYKGLGNKHSKAMCIQQLHTFQ